jgi:transposase
MPSKLARSRRAGIEVEAFRDLARARAAAREDLRRARHRLKSFPLAHAVRYTGSANWGKAHRRGLGRCSFPSAWQHLAFDEHRCTIEDRLVQCARLETALREAVISWRFYPVVLALRAMRGVQFATAVAMVSEVGDLLRFEHPQQMAWLDVTPSEHSSGGKRRQDSITKTGNSYARRLQVEVALSYRHPARVSPEIQACLEGLSKAIIDPPETPRYGCADDSAG